MAKKAAKRQSVRARRQSSATSRKAQGRKAGARRKTTGKTARNAAAKRTARKPVRRSSPAVTKPKGVRKQTARRGGSGLESTLAQTPETGRTVRGRTNPMPTKRSTGTAAGAGNTRRVPGLERARRQLREVEETIPTPPSSLNPDHRRASAAATGRGELRESIIEHNEVSPEITAGDVDADWKDAYSVGDEAPGGDNPTPDQDRVDDIGKALGVEYEDNEELKASEKIAQRDRKRWELDPASSEDYPDRRGDVD